MKFTLTLVAFLFSSIVLSAQQKVKPGMDYHFSWDGVSSLLKVDLFYTPASKDSTGFVYGIPQIGNQTNIFKVLENLQCSSGDSISIDTTQHKIIAWHKTGGTKKLHYEINGSLLSPAKYNNANEQFRPQLVPGSFYSLSFNLFMQIDTGSYPELTYVWDKWPAGLGYFSSADPESKPDKRVVVNTSHLGDLYFAMDRGLVIGKYLVRQVPYYAVTTTRDSINDMQTDLKPFFSTFFPAITSYWNDYEAKDYFVSVLPFLHHVQSTYTGFGLTDGFTMRYSGPYNIEKKVVIAHETSHKWIGEKLQIRQKGMEYGWFQEGFNDYVQINILAATSMISQAEFLDYINNKNLAPHYKSPVRTARADSVEKYFWTNHYYEKLPYQRGFIYAFYFDNQIRLASGGRKTIRDFLLALLKMASAKKNGYFTIDDYIQTASLFLPRDQVTNDINKYLQGGALLDFHSIKLIDGFRVNYINDVPVLTMSADANLMRILAWKN
jgi:hypothetical protein